MQRREWLILGLILLAGFGLRLGYLFELRADPSFENPAFDAAYHDYWAWGVVSGDWARAQGLDDPRISATPYFRPPAYPYFLAGVYAVAGHSYLAARLVQIALGLSSVVLGCFLGRRLFGSAVGLTFAALLATYWILIFFEGELLAPVLLVLLSLALLLSLARVADRFSPGSVVLAGVVAGLFSLARPNALALIPVVALWIAWVARRHGVPSGLRLVGIFAISSALVILPAALRNRIASGEWALITANGGVNLYIGNNPGADGTSAAIPEIRELTGRVGWTCFDYPAVVRGLSQQVGRPLTYGEASRIWAERATGFIRENPAEFARLTARRVALFWGPAEVGNNRDVQRVREGSRVLRLVPLGFPAVLALGLVGLLLFLAQRREGLAPAAENGADAGTRFEMVVLMATVVVVYFATFVPFFVAARYRVPILPVLLLGAAYTLVSLVWMARRRRWVRAGVWTATAVVLFALAGINWAGYESRRDEWHFSLGSAYGQQGRMELAAAEYLTALELNPRHSVAHNNLGLIRLKQGRIDEGVVHLERALQLNPDDPNAQFNLGALLLRLDRLDDAIAAYRAGLRFSPDDAPAHTNLAKALLETGSTADALVHYEQAVSLAPGLPQAWIGLGRARLAAGQPGQAEEALLRAEQLRPDSGAVHFYLGNALEQSGRSEEAAARYRRALSIRPDYEPAAAALRRLDGVS